MTGLQMLGGLLMGGSLFGTFRLASVLLQRRAAHRDPVSVMAKVLRLERSSTEGDLDDWFIPVVEYRSEDGQVHQSKLAIVKASDAPKVGKKVHVIYERGHPKNCLEPNASSSDSIAFYLALVGLLLVFALGAGLSFQQITFDDANPMDRQAKPEGGKAKQ